MLCIHATRITEVGGKLTCVQNSIFEKGGVSSEDIQLLVRNLAPRSEWQIDHPKKSWIAAIQDESKLLSFLEAWSRHLILCR
jgi:hypothetical protein